MLVQGKWSLTQEMVMGSKKWHCQTMGKVKTEKKGVRSNDWNSWTQENKE